MPWLWSNPDPSNATSAVLSAPYKVEAANIGPVLQALMHYRSEQQQQRDKQFNDLISGVAKGASGAYGAYQSGQADDAANAAIYGMQNPNDQYGGYTNPDVVPDYGGTDALKGIAATHRIDPEAFDPLARQYKEAQINALQAQANQRWTGDYGNDMTPRQAVTTANDAQKAAQAAFEQYGVPEGAINNQSAIHAPSDTPAIYRKGDSAVTVPQGQYLMVDPQTGEYIYRTPDDLTGARKALEDYRNAQQHYRDQLGVGNGAAASAAAADYAKQAGYGSAGVRQGDVNQAKDALKPETVLVQQAKDAIAQGADPEQVKARLKQYGISASDYGL